MNLAEAFAKVEVTESQAIALLNNLAEGHSDRDPELVSAINKAIGELASGPPATKSAEEDHASSSSGSPSRTSSRS